MAQHQENICVDALTDRCIVSGYEFEDIGGILETVFGKVIYNEQFVKQRAEKVAVYQKQLEYLKTIPILEQRTPEWHAARQTLITASDFAQALGDGKFGTREQLLRKKCGYEEDKFNASAPALKWGTMFEPVANDIYGQRNKMKVFEFGLLRHPTIPHFGASPDGVNECGIMVEIKCPFRRKIDGTVPLQYYYQIQGQLEVTNLEECDYFECEFFSSDDVDDIFDEPGDGEMGAIIENPEDHFEYSLTSCTWTREELAKWTNMKQGKILYFKLKKASTIRVYKDQNFVDQKLAQLSTVWDKIMEYRADEELYKKEVKQVTAESAYKPPAKFTGWAFD